MWNFLWGFFLGVFVSMGFIGVALDESEDEQ